MCEVKDIDRVCKMVTFLTSWGSIAIRDNKIVAQVGYLTPAEEKSCYRKYNAIMNENDDATPEELEEEKWDDYYNDIASGLSMND